MNKLYDRELATKIFAERMVNRHESGRYNSGRFNDNRMIQEIAAESIKEAKVFYEEMLKKENHGDI